VLNRHREVVYGKRKIVLETFNKEFKNELPEGEESLKDIILDMVEQEIEQVVSFHTNTEDRKDWNIKEILETVVTIFPLSENEKNEITNIASAKHSGKTEDIGIRTELIEYLVLLAKEKYEEHLVKQAPDRHMMLEIEKQVLLRGMDNLWVDHLVAVDYLRTGIGLRGYGQHDPLVEYKKETFRMFNELLNLIQKEVVYLIYKVSLGIQMAPSVMQRDNLVLKGAEKESGEHAIRTGKAKNDQGETIGRNDPCPCGSGLKYKRCHGK
jgi:preprotein translocase subunit SecA